MKKLIILFCLCLSSLSFAITDTTRVTLKYLYDKNFPENNKKIRQPEIASLIRGEVELIKMSVPQGTINSFMDRLDNIAKYANLLDSDTIANDKYDNCIKDIIIEINTYKKIIHKLEKMQGAYNDDMSLETSCIPVDRAVRESEAIKICIDQLNNDVKNKVNELIEKLK